jgi:hypothetical protein
MKHPLNPEVIVLIKWNLNPRTLVGWEKPVVIRLGGLKRFCCIRMDRGWMFIVTSLPCLLRPIRPLSVIWAMSIIVMLLLLHSLLKHLLPDYSWTLVMPSIHVEMLDDHFPSRIRLASAFDHLALTLDHQFIYWGVVRAYVFGCLALSV